MAPSDAEGGLPSGEAIREYLLRLEAAAAGQDAALVHDMIVDASEHLREAVASGRTPKEAIEEFGDPVDVAAAYIEADRGPSAAPAAGRAGAAKTAAVRPTARPAWDGWPVVGVWFQREAWGALLFFLLGLVPATIWFAAVVSGVSFSLGTLPLIIGLPALVLVLGACRGMSLLHGQLVQALLGVRMPRRMERVAPEGAGGAASAWGRIKLWLKDVRSWLSMAFLFGNFPVAVALFTVFVSLVATGVSLVAAPLVRAFELGGRPVIMFFGQPLADSEELLLLILAVPLGLAILTGTLWLAKGLGWVYGQVVKAIQVTRPVTGGQVTLA